MHKTLISEMSWYEFRDAMAFNDLIIIPVGSNEEHGPHNPLGTDTILARELARRIESELEYPGQIKVHVLRETKVVEYAK